MRIIYRLILNLDYDLFRFGRNSTYILGGDSYG